MSGHAAEDGAWRPAADLATLRRRAALLARIRAFFATRDVLEVETPCLSHATVTDLHLQSLATDADLPAAGRRRLYLQTSPEFAMKRLLAAGSGAIYQLARAFRDGEAGRRHNPEFTLLEWYRPGFDHHDLMDEMDGFLAHALGDERYPEPAERLTYAEAFVRHAGVDPHRASIKELAERTAALGIDAPGFDADTAKDDWLHLILSHAVEPRLRGAAFVHDFPASQAALARIRPGNADQPDVAERFEVYLDGVELANGFHELTDAAEQRRRFEADLAARRQAGLPQVPLDEKLLAALEHGLPECAGVALGVDRLFLMAEGEDDLRRVMAFPVDRA